MATDRQQPTETRPRRHLRVTLCGPVTVEGPAGESVLVRGRQPQAVVAFLATEGRPVQRDELAEVLWGERVSAHWQGALRGVLSKVRAALVEAGLPATALRSEDTMVWLDVAGGVVTDVDEVDAAIAEAALAAGGGDHGRAVAALDPAAATLARPFLAQNDSEWSRARRQVLAGLAAQVAHRRVSALLASGQASAAVGAARARTAEDPLDETAQHLLIEALVADGQRADAIVAFARFEEVLRAELGIAPGVATAQLLEPALSPTGPVSDPEPWRPPAGASGRRARPLHAHDGDPFVGRHHELEHLDTAWQRAVATRRPRLVLLEGPAGIGKTRLASHIGGRLAAAGHRVVSGRCRTGASRAFGPIAEALDRALSGDPTLVDRLGARAAGLVSLLPHLGDQLDGPPPADAGMARTQLFGAVTATIAELAATPTLLVLDDLHWASVDTLALLEVVLDGLEGPLLVVATARTVPTPLASALMAIQRLVPVTSIRLDGLSVGDLVDLVGGHPAPATADEHALAVALHSRTAGLPFFVSEITRAARQAGTPIDPASAPDAVRDWIARRVTALPKPIVDLIELAAVIGSDVDLAVLERAAIADADALTAGLDELDAHGLLTDAGEAGRVAFSHAITRDVVYDRLSAARRARLHRRIGDALAAGPRSPETSALLAHHYGEAGPELRATAACHAHDAGCGHLAGGAWEDAAVHFERSLALADDPPARARALVGLGQARLRQNRFERARQALEDALALARSHALPLEGAEATLALAGRAGRGAAPGESDEAQEARLRAALGALADAPAPGPDTGDDGGDDGPRRAALLSALERELALALLLSDAAEERRQLLDRSLHRIRSQPQSDPSALAEALLGMRMSKLAPDCLASRLADIDEVLSLPTHRLSPEVLIAAHCYRHEDLVRIGDRDAAAEALAAAAEVAERHPHPYWQWAIHTWRALGSIIDGDLDRAEALALEASQMQPGVAEAAACLGVNLVNIRLHQRRAVEVLDLLAQAADQHPQIPCYRAVLALCASEAGHLDGASSAYRFFADERFANLPEDTNRFLGLAVLAHVAVDLGDGEGGGQLADLLAPYRGQRVLLNCYGGGGAVWGPTDYALARLALLAGRRHDAAALFDAATAEAAGSPMVLARIAGHARTMRSQPG